MKLVYLGSGEFGIDCLNAIERSDHSLGLVVTQPPRQAGRGQKPTATPAARWAKEHGVRFIEPADVNAPEVVEQIAVHRPELIVVAAFGQKIGNELINLPPEGIINAHASLVPKYRGAAPINWAIINGETESGVSIIKVVEKMDAGDILAQARTPIAPDETAGQLHDKLAKIAGPLLIETINKIADGSCTYTPQDDSKATSAPKLKKSDGFLDFAEPAQILQRKIRGLWPWPGASAIYISQDSGKGQRVTIAQASVVDTKERADLAPGTFDNNLCVVCGEKALRITKIKPAGASLMSFKAFTNGRSTRPGDRLVRIDN